MPVSKRIAASVKEEDREQKESGARSQRARCNLFTSSQCDPRPLSLPYLGLCVLIFKMRGLDDLPAPTFCNPIVFCTSSDLQLLLRSKATGSSPSGIRYLNELNVMFRGVHAPGTKWPAISQPGYSPLPTPPASGSPRLLPWQSRLAFVPKFPGSPWQLLLPRGTAQPGVASGILGLPHSHNQKNVRLYKCAV